jgi:hypothetical protein
MLVICSLLIELKTSPSLMAPLACHHRCYMERRPVGSAYEIEHLLNQRLEMEDSVCFVPRTKAIIAYSLLKLGS